MERYEYGNVTYIMKNMVSAVMTKHRDIVNDYAVKGYRYVGTMPTEISANGCIRGVDLILEEDGVLRVYTLRYASVYP